MIKLNEHLIKKQGLSGQAVEKLQELHQLRIEIEKEMENTDDSLELKELFKEWTSIQYDLQSVWGFSVDNSYHKWWYVPKCTCPKMDNDDFYPTGYSIRDLSCPVHGD